MTVFMKFRDDLRKFFSKHAGLLERLVRGLVWFVSAMLVDTYMGYAEIPGSPLVAAGMAVFLAFIPYSAGSLVFIVFILIQLFSVNLSTGLTGLLVFLFCYIICGIYRSRRPEYLALMPITYRLGFPFAIPLFSALFGRGRDAGAVVCGCITTWYMKSVVENYALITDKTNPLSPTQLLSQNMILNPMFYCFMGAAAAMFLVAYTVRMQSIAYAWQIGAISGTVAEFAIMLAADLFFDHRADIPALVGSNAVIMVAALIASFLLRDFDFHRTERLRFEDDEYYYFVTAVPKIRLASEKNEVKTITGEEGAGANETKAAGDAKGAAQ